MRLLILSDYWGDLGGGELVAAQLARALRDRFDVAILSTDRRRESREHRDGLLMYRVRSDYPARIRPLLAVANPLTLSGVRRVLRDFKPDVVHAWNVHQHLSYASLGLARRSGAPTVLTFQDVQPFCYTKYHCYIDRAAPCPPRPDYRARPATCRACWRHYWLFPPRNRAVHALIGRYVSRRVAVSQALADALADNGLPGAQVIHNCLPLEEFPPSRASVDAVRLRFNLGAEVVVGGGRFGFFKGQQQLIEAFARVARERPTAQLVLAGHHKGEVGALLQARVAQLGLSERVTFSGFLSRPDMLALLAAGALYANLSLAFDSFPTVNLEVGAAGRPIIGTCFGGTPEVVLDGVTGRLVNPYRTDQVVQLMVGLLASAEHRTQMGRRAAERVRTVFPMSAMVEAYADVFTSLA